MIVFFFVCELFDSKRKKTNMIKLISLGWILIKWSRVENKIYKSNSRLLDVNIYSRTIYSFEEICRILAPIAIRRSVTFKSDGKKKKTIASFLFCCFHRQWCAFPMWLSSCAFKKINFIHCYGDGANFQKWLIQCHMLPCTNILRRKWEDRITITVRLMLLPETQAI